jgi:C_GCAxxG_C_C family probable redox protein
MDRTEEALATFNNGFNCAQAVLSAFSEKLGMNRDLALKVASGMGAGLGHQGRVCGVVFGAYLVLSLRAGSSHPNDELSKELVYNLTRRFDTSFLNIHKALNCSELLEVDMSTPEGYSAALEQGLFDTKCQLFVKDAVRIIEQIFDKLDRNEFLNHAVPK